MTEAQNRVRRFTREAACSTTEQGLESNDETWEKFPEPQGWALKWDGFALSEIREQQNGRAPLPITESR